MDRILASEAGDPSSNLGGSAIFFQKKQHSRHEKRIMNNDEKTEENSQEIDLSSLSALDFNPQWANEDAKKFSAKTFSDGNERRKFHKKPFGHGGNSSSQQRNFGEKRARDRRPNFQKNSEFGNDKFSKKFENELRAGTKKPRFLPKVADVTIYPDDKKFSALAKAIKASARTYVLFEIAQLILEKPERFVVVVSPPTKKDKAGNPLPSDVHAAPFVVSDPAGLPFLNENDALSHVFKNHFEKFFDAEEIEVEAPKGNFAMLSKCGFTGTLLAPPNYHAYQQILREHHAANFPKMPFDKFLSRIETVKEPEEIAAWIEKMKKSIRYSLKEKGENDPEFFENENAAKTFLANERKALLVKETKQARFAGALLEKMPIGPLLSTIQREISYQQKFPLNTANALRGKLRHSGFALYKQSQSGITLVSSVKRKFRSSTSVFSETIQNLFDFLDKNPGTTAAELPAKMLGIGSEEKAAKAAPKAEENAVPAEKISSEAQSENPENAVPAEQKTLSLEEEFKAKELAGTIRWLVNEGYVTEMADGKLFAQPILDIKPQKPAEAPKNSKKAEKKSDALFEEKSVPEAENSAETTVVKIVYKE